MCTYVRTYVRVCFVCVYVLYIYIYIYDVCMHMHIYMCVCVCVYVLGMYVFMYVCTYVRKYVCVCVCIYMCIRTYVCTYICMHLCVCVRERETDRQTNSSLPTHSKVQITFVSTLNLPYIRVNTKFLKAAIFVIAKYKQDSILCGAQRTRTLYGKTLPNCISLPPLIH